ncbi:BPSS1780 family membrane protein [Chitinimonas sp. BJYL2]|uniref:BPSS1780 family membrane protein n=1 Tax=Chitinimonas sp. BJYL2 TaxID=2976696 RepID=UPI0022B304AB|nr:BPSS1780 family membrane protein [Chitinimonas sp. BJYL2]
MIHSELEFRTVAAGRGAAWISEGFDLFRRQPGVWIGVIVIWFIASLMVSVVPFGQVLATLFTPVLLGGLMIGCAQLKRGEELEVAHLFAGFQKPFAPLVLIGLILLVAQIVLFAIVIGLAMVAGLGAIFSGVFAGMGDNPVEMTAGAAGLGASVLLLVLIGLIALLIYLIILLPLTFAPGLVALGGADALPALRASIAAMLANWAPLLVFSLICLLLMIVAVIPLMLGFLVLMPVMTAAMYAAYRDIFADMPEHIPEE